MSKVYILCGKIASGKTYLAHTIQKEKGGIILSHDEIMLKIFDDCIGPEAHLAAALKISSYFVVLAKQIISLNDNVILDYGFWSKDERDFLVEALKKANLAYELIWVKCDDKTRIKRLDERNKANALLDGRQYIISQSMMEGFDAKFEALGVDEGHSIYESAKD